MPKRITLLVDEGWHYAINTMIAEVQDGEICEVLTIEDVPNLPCRTCGTDVEPDIYLTELGFCVPCQHAYFEETN
jgi:hypothetical protein